MGFFVPERLERAKSVSLFIYWLPHGISDHDDSESTPTAKEIDLLLFDGDVEGVVATIAALFA